MTGFAWGAATDVGRVRPSNEDAFVATPGLFAVADGMGGHRGGSVASRLALETLRERFGSDDGPRTTERLVRAVEEANEALVARAEEDPDLRGMGTTLTAMALVVEQDREVLGVVNVGDSRLYLLKDGELEQITEDHSLVATLERQGRITRAEAAVHPQRNILTRALGIDAKVMVDSWEILPIVGDRYLLCSDGLFNEVADGRIEATLRKLADPSEAAHELVRLANEAGGHDNVTCVVVDVVADGEGGRTTSAREGQDGRSGPAPPAEPVAGPGAAPRPTHPPGPVAGPVRATARLRNRFTWRTAAFVLALATIGAVAVGSITWAGTRTYYVGIDGDRVAIFRGQPGGVLWIEPSLAEVTDLRADQLPASVVIDLEAGKTEGSLDDARAYVENLRRTLPAPTARSSAPPVVVPGPATSTPSTTPTTSTTPAPADAGSPGAD